MSTPNELRRPKDFANDYPEVGSFNSLRWQLRNRHINGMLASGAIIEFYPGETRSRPTLFVDVPQYFKWQRGAA